MPTGELDIPDGCIVSDSVTTLGAEARGAILISGSHGGAYSAYLAAKAGVAGVILNDAAVGKDGAGIGGLDYLDHLGVSMATVGHETARIGDGFDCARHGVVTHVNNEAAARGVVAGISAREAAARLLDAKAVSAGEVPNQGEDRFQFDLTDLVRPVHVMDSNSLVARGDEGSVIVTGSHGGLLGGRPETAVKINVFAALYNDAGVGKDGAGISRLSALDARNIAAGTIDAWSARIGDGRSCLESGVVSHINETAARYGASSGTSALEFVRLMARIEKNEEPL